MPAGEPLEPDVAEGLDEQRGGALGVPRRVSEVDGAAEPQLVADDIVAAVRDRMADDGDLGTFRGGSAHTCNVGRSAEWLSANCPAPGHSGSTSIRT